MACALLLEAALQRPEAREGAWWDARRRDPERAVFALVTAQAEDWGVRDLRTGL